MASGIVAVIWIRGEASSCGAGSIRRFFREAYDAEQILSDLGDQVRTMVETGPLLETVAKQISASLHVPHVVMMVRNHVRYEAAYAFGLLRTAGRNVEDSAGTVRNQAESRTLCGFISKDNDSWIYREPGSRNRSVSDCINSTRSFCCRWRSRRN